MSPLAQPFGSPMTGSTAPLRGAVTQPLPSRHGVLPGAIGRPSGTAANTMGVVSGPTAHQALNGRVQDDSTYVQATAQNQAVAVTLDRIGELIPPDAGILFIRVTMRARSVGAGAGLLRIEPLTALTDNDDTTVSQQLSVPTTPTTLTAVFAAQEQVSGSYAEWDLADLAAVAIRLVSTHASNHVRIFDVHAQAFHLPVITRGDFFDDVPPAHGWVSFGNLAADVSHGVAHLVDASASNFYQFTRVFNAHMVELGDVAVSYDIPSAWTHFDGVFGANALTVDIGDRYFQINLIKTSGVAKVGLLKGRETSFDPTLIGSYQATATYDWEAGYHHTFTVAWDGANVRVYAHENLILTVAESAIGAGTGTPAYSLGTGFEGIGLASRGELRLLACFSRGLQEFDGWAAVLDFEERQEMSIATAFNSTRLLWHHSSRTFDAYRIRFGGGSFDTGYFIGPTHGSTNTEVTGVSIAPEVPVESVIALGDLLPNDIDPDGARIMKLYTRDASTHAWSTTALEIPISIFRTPPLVTIPDFLDVESTALLLTADREFSVIPEIELVPAGDAQAVDLTYNGLDGEVGTVTPVFEPHADGFPGIPTVVDFDPLAAIDPNTLALTPIPLDQGGNGQVRCFILDAHGLVALRILNFQVRDRSPFENAPLDGGYRFAVPATTRRKDPNLEPYLKIFDGLLGQTDKIFDDVRLLIDPRNVPDSALGLVFREAGLKHPDVPGYPRSAKNRLLLNATKINKTRFTLNGLLFYLELLLPGTTAVVTGFHRGFFIFCDEADLGLPTEADLATAGHDDDECRYLIGPLQDQTITITITGTVSAGLREFVESTVRAELIMADDPVIANRPNIVVVWV